MPTAFSKSLTRLNYDEQETLLRALAMRRDHCREIAQSDDYSAGLRADMQREVDRCQALRNRIIH